MRCSEIINIIEQLSPKEFASEWDNVGLIIGRQDKNVEKVVIALDATEETIEKAIQLNADLLITHHPIIFTGIKKICAEEYIGEKIINLIKNDICCYALHTNFDVMGMADAAADELGMKQREVLEILFEDDISKEGFGRIGKLPWIMSTRECAEHIKKCFQVDSVRVYGELEATHETVAILPGSGADAIEMALQANVDIYITGDIKYHVGLEAKEKGLTIIDAGHYGLEKIFMNYMKEYLNRKLPMIEVHIIKQTPPFCNI